MTCFYGVTQKLKSGAVFLLAAGAFGLLLSMPEAKADGYTASGGTSTGSSRVKGPAWSDSSKYHDCGQSCFYQKGNENISLDATYVLTKIDGLKQKLADKKDSEVIEDLRGYCASGEGAADCLERYSYYESARLGKMRGSIIQNENSVYLLKNDKGKNNKGSAAVTNKVDKGGKKFLPLTPEFLAQKEMEDAAMQYYSSHGYERWRQEKEVKPEENDYFAIKAEKRDSKKPGQGDLYVIDASPEAQGKAKRIFQADQKRYKDGMDKDGIAGGWTDVNRKNPQSLVFSKKPGASELEKDAFQKARAVMVETTNKALNKSNDGRVSASSGARGPAGNQEIKVKTMAPTENEELVTVTWSPEDLDKEIQKIDP